MSFILPFIVWFLSLILFFYFFYYIKLNIILFALQIQYAFEILSNPIWKRDYDIFGIDEHLVSFDIPKLVHITIYTMSDIGA